MTPVRCPTCDLPVPRPVRSAGKIYCTAACRSGAQAVQRLRSRLQAAEAAGDISAAQIERDRLEATVSRIRLERARRLGRRPKLRVRPSPVPEE